MSSIYSAVPAPMLSRIDEQRFNLIVSQAHERQEDAVFFDDLERGIRKIVIANDPIDRREVVG